MQYIIMCDGKGRRWDNYLGITKQEALIEGERLLDRIVRLIKKYTSDPVLILSSNPKHVNNDSTRILPEQDDYFHHKYAYDFLNQETTFIYGDTYYTDKLIEYIIQDTVDNIMFYGNEKAIVAVKVGNYELLKEVLDRADPEKRSLYHAFDGFSDSIRGFTNVGQSFININTSLDYDNLSKTKKRLLRKEGI